MKFKIELEIEKAGFSLEAGDGILLLQKGILPIPKASSYEHMRANAAIFDFELSEDDLWMLSCMPQTTWLGEHPDFFIPTKKSNPNQ